MDISAELVSIGQGAAYFGVLLVLIVLGRLAMKALAGYKLDDELTKHDNPAVAISFAGYLAGMLLALSGAFVGETRDFVVDLGQIALWGAFAIAALNLSRIVTDKILLAGFGNVEELARDRNIGVGVCEAGGYIASGLIIRAAISGEGAWWLGPVYVVIGITLLVVASIVLKAIVFKKYNLKKEIEEDNAAAGILYGLHVLAIGQLLHAILADTGVEEVIAKGAGAGEVAKTFGIEIGFGILYLAIGLVAMAILNALTDRLMLPSHKLHDEIVKDRNSGAALVAGTVSIFGAFVIMLAF